MNLKLAKEKSGKYFSMNDSYIVKGTPIDYNSEILLKIRAKLCLVEAHETRKLSPQRTPNKKYIIYFL